VILPTDGDEIAESKAHPNHIPPIYWNAAGSLYAYLFIDLAKQGIDVIGSPNLSGIHRSFRAFP